MPQCRCRGAETFNVLRRHVAALCCRRHPAPIGKDVCMALNPSGTLKAMTRSAKNQFQSCTAPAQSYDVPKRSQYCVRPDRGYERHSPDGIILEGEYDPHCGLSLSATAPSPMTKAHQAALSLELLLCSELLLSISLQCELYPAQSKHSAPAQLCRLPATTMDLPLELAEQMNALQVRLVGGLRQRGFPVCSLQQPP